MPTRDDQSFIVSLPPIGPARNSSVGPWSVASEQETPWSRRDLAILEMLARNSSRTDVAARLGCSTSTVDRRLAVLRHKLGVATTIQVIVAAVRRGLI